MWSSLSLVSTRFRQSSSVGLDASGRVLQSYGCMLCSYLQLVVECQTHCHAHGCAILQTPLDFILYGILSSGEKVGLCLFLSHQIEDHLQVSVQLQSNCQLFHLFCGT